MGAGSGHGISLAYEAPDESGDIVGGTFTTVGQLVSDLPDELSRAYDGTTPHDATINEGIFSNVLTRAAWDIQVNYDHGSAAHKGLRTHLINNKEFGFRLRGPLVTDSSDEVIVSGKLLSWRRANPVRQGARSGQGSFQPVGRMKIDGVLVGVESA